LDSDLDERGEGFGWKGIQIAYLDAYLDGPGLTDEIDSYSYPIDNDCIMWLTSMIDKSVT
jgi:hypothetical protein